MKEEEVSMKNLRVGEPLRLSFSIHIRIKGGNMKYYYGLSYFEICCVCVLCTYSNIGCAKLKVILN